MPLTVYRLMYDSKTHDFTDLPEECHRLGETLPAYQHCPSCGRKAEEELSQTVRVVSCGLSQYNRTYHIGDFVYVKPDAGNKENIRLFIAQIIDIDREAKKLQVRYYKRHADDPVWLIPFSLSLPLIYCPSYQRRIYRIRLKNFVDVADLDGLCFVRHLDRDEPADQEEIEAWVDSHPDNFYTNQKEKGSILDNVVKADFDCCSDCLQQHCEELEEAKRLVRRVGRIPVLEVFSGIPRLRRISNFQKLTFVQVRVVYPKE